MDWFGALVACCKPMESVYIGNQLLDCVHQACHCTCGEEECHEEEVQGKHKFPVPQAERPATRHMLVSDSATLIHKMSSYSAVMTAL